MDDQLAREDLVTMPYTDVARAVHEGRCDDLLGRIANTETVSSAEAAEANAEVDR